MKRILFLCTHNSARSQMAEALVNHDLAGRLQAFSAGSEPSRVHPLAVTAMRELGIDISAARAKSLNEYAQENFDYVITLCDQANAVCPMFFGRTRRMHMGFPDPATATGTEAEKLAAFRKARDDIREKIVGFLAHEKEG
jgi:arsenate reductase (thioredoxin)